MNSRNIIIKNGNLEIKDLAYYKKHSVIKKKLEIILFFTPLIATFKTFSRL